MKVTRNTPDQLILSDTPWFIGFMLILFILAFVGAGTVIVLDGVWQGALFGLAGGGMGFAGFAVFVRRVQVILDRPENALILRRRSVFGYQAVQHDLADLSEARLERTTSSKGTVMYRPVLVLDGGMSAGTHPIIESYTSTGGPKRLVDAVNTWLAASRESTPRVDLPPRNA